MVVTGITNMKSWRETKMQENRTRREAEDGNENKLLEIIEIMGNEEKLKRTEGTCRKLTWNGRRTEATETKKNRGKECD